MFQFLKNKWWHTVLCAIFILILSLIPQESIPHVGFTRTDLIVHLTMYGGLAWCLHLSLFDLIRTNASRSHLIFGVLTIGLFGFSIELLQKILPFNRFFSWADVACNFLGASAFYFFAQKVKSTH